MDSESICITVGFLLGLIIGIGMAVSINNALWRDSLLDNPALIERIKQQEVLKREIIRLGQEK